MRVDYAERTWTDWWYRGHRWDDIDCPRCSGRAEVCLDCGGVVHRDEQLRGPHEAELRYEYICDDCFAYGEDDE